MSWLQTAIGRHCQWLIMEARAQIEVAPAVPCTPLPAWPFVPPKTHMRKRTRKHARTHPRRCTHARRCTQNSFSKDRSLYSSFRLSSLVCSQRARRGTGASGDVMQGASHSFEAELMGSGWCTTISTSRLPMKCSLWIESSCRCIGPLSGLIRYCVGPPSIAAIALSF